MDVPRRRGSISSGGCALGSLVALTALSWAVAAAAVTGAVRASAPLLAHGWSAQALTPWAGLEAMITTLVLLLGATLAARYGLAAGLAVVLAGATRRGRRLPRTEVAIRAFAPPTVRRALALAVGGALGVALTVAPASASTQVPDDLRWSPGTATLSVVTDRQSAAISADTAPLAASAPAATDPAPDARAHHEVRPGESLWAIAAASLEAGGRAATAAAVAAEWPRWYASNADVIGPDPGVIRPGQLLTAPEEGPVS